LILKYWNRVLIVVSSIFFIAIAMMTDFDTRGEVLINDSIKEAGIVFGVAKGLNAVISLAQGTEVGVGLTISAGEVLDPINDLIERFSLVMLASIVSLGIQKILMNFVIGQGFNTILILFIVIANIWLFFRFKNDTKVRRLFFKTTAVLIFFRFSISLLSMSSHYVYINYVQQDYNIEQAKESVNKTSEQIGKVTFNKFSLDYYEKEISKYKLIAEKASEQVVDLMIAFIFKTIFFPLLFLFLLYKLIWNLFRYRDT